MKAPRPTRALDPPAPRLTKPAAIRRLKRLINELDDLLFELERDDVDAPAPRPAVIH